MYYKGRLEIWVCIQDILFTCRFHFHWSHHEDMSLKLGPWTNLNSEQWVLTSSEPSNNKVVMYKFCCYWEKQVWYWRLLSIHTISYTYFFFFNCTYFFFTSTIKVFISKHYTTLRSIYALILKHFFFFLVGNRSYVSLGTCTKYL